MELFDYQKVNLEEMKSILENNNFCINISPTGLGKSVVSFELSKQFNNLFIISINDILEQVWKPLTCPENNTVMISLEVWRGRKKCELKHPYLNRKDSSKGASYDITCKLKSLIADKTLFVIDEFQFIKNKNKGYHAVEVLVKNIKGSNSRCLFLSATPIDKHIQVKNYIELFGENFEDKMCFMDGSKKNHIEGFNIFANVSVPFYGTKFQDKEMQLEKAKIDIFCQRALQYLKEKKKVIVAVMYIETIDILIKRLKDYDPLRLDGQNKEDRSKYVEMFQADNFKYPLIVANLSVISTGISLDDKYGTYPRVMIISPNNFVMKTKQLAHRIDRITTKSNSVVEIIFAKNLDEKRVRELLYEKAEIMKKYSKEEGMFPHDYTDVNV